VGERARVSVSACASVRDCIRSGVRGRSHDGCECVCERVCV